MNLSWHPSPQGYSASLIVDGVCLVRLHARDDAWQIEDCAGIKAGPAGSVEHAKRVALEALAEVLRKAVHEVDVALRET